VWGKNTPEEVRRSCLNILQNSMPFLGMNDDIKDPQLVHGKILMHFFEALVGRDAKNHTLALERLAGKSRTIGESP
jgi:hypothetical protein